MIVHSRLTLALLVALTALWASACANPRPPGGGPRDETPPRIEASRPEAGAVNVSEESVRIHFSEHVDQGSFAQAFSVTPAMQGQPTFRWSGRDLRIIFPEPLRENTTYVITIDTELSDVHGVSLQEPITLAFATGSRINRGRLAGHVLDAQDGTGLAGYDVFAYATDDGTAPEPLPERPTYRTQTGPDGRFQFEYMNEQPYFIIALQDDNRNLQPDPQEPYAVPPSAALLADTTVADMLPRWLAAAQDTLPPELQRLRALSQQRLELRYNERVQLPTLDPEAWEVRDSAQSRRQPVQAVFHHPDAPNRVYLLTEALPSTRHFVIPGPVMDQDASPASRDTLFFTPPPTADTAQLRFERFLPRPASDTLHVLNPDELPGVRFSEPVPADRLTETLALRDTAGTERPFSVQTEDGTAYRLRPEPPFNFGETLQLTVNAFPLTEQDTVYSQRFQRVEERELGSLSGVVEAEDTTAAVIVELIDAESEQLDIVRRQRIEPRSQFLFEQLPEGQYRFRAFSDRNDNERWDAGRIRPYEDAEPLTWTRDPAPWRARWENELADTLRIPAR